MSKLPYTENTEVFTMRISKTLKNKLIELSYRNKFDRNCSAVIRDLIESEHNR